MKKYSQLLIYLSIALFLATVVIVFSLNAYAWIGFRISSIFNPTAPTTPDPPQRIEPQILPIPISAVGAEQIDAAGKLGQGKVYGVAFSPNGKFFSAATSAGIGFYDAETLTQQVPHTY